jgi:hypothetical protein
MSFKQVCTFLFLVSTLTSAFIIGLIILFDNVLDTLAAHSNQLARLNPDLVRTTIIGVFAFMGVSVAARVVMRWTQGRNSPRQEQTTEVETEFDELWITKPREADTSELARAALITVAIPCPSPAKRSLQARHGDGRTRSGHGRQSCDDDRRNLRPIKREGSRQDSGKSEAYDYDDYCTHGAPRHIDQPRKDEGASGEASSETRVGAARTHNRSACHLTTSPARRPVLTVSQEDSRGYVRLLQVRLTLTLAPEALARPTRYLHVTCTKASILLSMELSGRQETRPT